MSKYDDVYFMGHDQAINQVRVGSSKTRNWGAFSGSLAAFIFKIQFNVISKSIYNYI